MNLILMARRWFTTETSVEMTFFLLLLLNIVSGQIILQTEPQGDTNKPLAQFPAESSSTPTPARIELEFDANELYPNRRFEEDDIEVANEMRYSLPRCGMNFVNEGHKIVGGRHALIGEFPWQVSLQTAKFSGRYSHYCGAAIISPHWIITASHCVDDFVPSEIKAVSGAWDLRKVSSYYGGQHQTYISKIIMHADYDSEHNLRNDIALLKVSNPFDLSSSSLMPINSVCLPQSGLEVFGHATVSGWGKLSESGGLSDTLRAVNVTVMGDSECRTFYGQRIQKKMVCAGYIYGGKDACQGDSGGPLVQKVNGRYNLIGVVSWGIGCARAESPGVYTQVSQYIDWIHRVIATK
jgi:secreted trypsin-like serine protease